MDELPQFRISVFIKNLNLISGEIKQAYIYKQDKKMDFSSAKNPFKYAYYLDF